MRVPLRALLSLLACLAWLGLAGPAVAIELEAARAQGLVGETARGYIAPVKGATPDVTALVNRINAARRSEYQRVAQRTASTLEQVELLAAQKLYAQVPPGTYVQSRGGGWTQK